MKTLRYLVGNFEKKTSLLGLYFHIQTSGLQMILSFSAGLIPQLIGVAPEKAIKLTVSFFVAELMSFI
jgi:hypothetical protein